MKRGHNCEYLRGELCVSSKPVEAIPPCMKDYYFKCEYTGKNPKKECVHHHVTQVEMNMTVRCGFGLEDRFRKR